MTMHEDSAGIPMVLAGAGAPVVSVRNRTRRSADMPTAWPALQADVAVPFVPELPAVGDQGWPDGRIPRRLRKPVAALTGRILAAAGQTAPAKPGLEAT